jgi:hypothetical protein
MLITLLNISINITQKNQLTKMLEIVYNLHLIMIKMLKYVYLAQQVILILIYILIYVKTAVIKNTIQL